MFLSLWKLESSLHPITFLTINLEINTFLPKTRGGFYRFEHKAAQQNSPDWYILAGYEIVLPFPKPFDDAVKPPCANLIIMQSR